MTSTGTLSLERSVISGSAGGRVPWPDVRASDEEGEMP